MFSEAWQALSCWGVLLLANVLTFAPRLHHAGSAKNGLSTLGWSMLLVGNVIPLGLVFFTAAMASRYDEGAFVALGVCVCFLCRCAYELAKIGPKET
jgi:hypothetical protein